MAVKIAEKEKPKSNLVGCPTLSWVYGLYIDGELQYVGSSENIEKRKQSHISNLQSIKHSNKKLQRKYVESEHGEITFTEILALPTSNSLIKFFAEMLVISALKSEICNAPHIQMGKMKMNFKACDRTLAIELLKVIADYYGVELNLPQ